MKTKKTTLIILIGISIFNQNVKAQSSSAFNTPTPGFYIGWSSISGIALPIKQEAAQPINFYTNAGLGTFNNQRMTIFDAPGAPFNAGFVGIGTAAPFHLLDVNGGDININTPTNGYRIVDVTFGSQYVLWHNGDPTNIFVGVQAGNGGMTGSGNTFTGFQAGLNLTSGLQNTFNGYLAGTNTTSGTENTYIGNQTGTTNTAGYSNTFLGCNAGISTDAEENTFVGCRAGQSNATGKHNTTIGFDADVMVNNLDNSTAIGNQCKVPDKNQMILGNNDVNVGIGLSGDNSLPPGPQNKLEINSDPTSFVYSGIQESGLTFRQLTNASTPLVNSGNLGLLSLDNNGKVIYVKDGSPFGGICGTGSTGLTNDWEIGLNGHNYIFSGNHSGADRVGIGPIGCTPQAKLDVYTTNDITAGRFINTFNIPSSTNGIEVQVINTSDAQIAGNFRCSGSPITNVCIGINSLASGSITTNTGGNFRGNGFASTLNNTGVNGNADGSNILNFGGRFGANGPSTGTNYGIYAAASLGAINWAAYFNGDVMINGNGFVNGGTPIISDQMFKTNIDSIPNTMSIIKQLKPRQFYFDTTNIFGMNFSSRKQYGFKAQDVETILPELVLPTSKPADLDSLGNIIHPAVTYKTLNYNAFFALSIRALQEQQRTIDSLKKQNVKQDSINASLQNQINHLANIITECCDRHNGDGDDDGHHDGGHHSPISNAIVKLTDVQNIILEQNVPNPFAEQTSIGYNLPDNTTKAQILFYNSNGKLIQSAELTNKGKGQLNVYAQDLSNGMYSYTLVVDGKIFETKKMVKQ